jgi:citrate synthase
MNLFEKASDFMDRLNDITEDIRSLADLCVQNNSIPQELYGKYEVKRGLRDLDGQGVLTGLTEVSRINSYKVVDRELIPIEGELYYHGINIEEIVHGFMKEGRFGFEEVIYLLLFGKLPTSEELDGLQQLLGEYRELPIHFVRDIVMKAPSKDMMNTLARSVLTLYAYDDKADDTSIPNVLRQSLRLIALFPSLAVYGYHAYSHYHDGKSLIIRQPVREYTTAQNFLHMLRPDGKFTDLEAKVLDIALVLHAEHGGGNNSTFTNHVVTSSGTDTYSAVAASLGSLKGPKHGGANVKVSMMFEDMKETVKNWEDEEEVKNYLKSLLHKEAFDKAGLIYGMGHAVYSISDPRANVFKSFVLELSEAKGRMKEFNLYSMVERLAPQVIAEERNIYKGVSANVDFYSGFVYSMLDLPLELYTPLFAIARIVGWSAHRLEELINSSRIIRPAYKAVSKNQEYVPLNMRTPLE